MQKDNMTVGQWCGQWFTANRPKWNGSTEGGYRNLIYSHIIPSIGSVALPGAQCRGIQNSPFAPGPAPALPERSGAARHAPSHLYRTTAVRQGR